MKRHHAVTLSLILSALSATSCCAESSPGVMGFSTLGWNVVHEEPQEAKGKQVLGALVPDLLARHQYNELEKLAESLRASKVYYPSGKTALSEFYRLTALPSDSTDQDYEKRIKEINQWWEQHPDSKTAPALLESYLCSYAWKARGGGYSDTVTKDGWKLFSERLARAHQVLDKALTKKDICPFVYAFGQKVALGESWDRKKYDQFVDEAVKRFPGDNEFYFNKAYYLQPRWNGEDTEWPDYAAKVSNKIGGADGDILYAQIAWHIFDMNFYENIFKEFPNLNWKRIDSGFLALSKKIPDNARAQSVRLKFALEAGKNAAAKDILMQLGKTIDIEVWQSKCDYFQMRKKLLGK